MINDFFIKIIDFVVLFLNPFLVKFQAVIDQVDIWIDSYFPIVLQWIKGITYFIPVNHILVIFGFLSVLLVIRVVFAVYDQVAQVIP